MWMGKRKLNKLLFMGTGEFACGCLSGLYKAGHGVDMVITKPDSPQGRSGLLKPPPVKLWAQEHGIECLQPSQVNTGEGRRLVEELAPDLLVAAEFGSILKRPLLDLPALGAINVHGSLLPKLRGAAPVQWALLSDFCQTGVTTIYMDEGIDTGDIILQRPVEILPDENYGRLLSKLAEIAGEILVETVDLIFAGRAPRKPQPENGVSYAPALTAEDERIIWDRSAREIVNHVRAFAPSPGAYALFRNNRIKLLNARTCEGQAAAGLVTGGRKQLMVGTENGLVEILELQPAGKKPMGAADFLNGYRVRAGESFL